VSEIKNKQICMHNKKNSKLKGRSTESRAAADALLKRIIWIYEFSWH